MIMHCAELYTVKKHQRLVHVNAKCTVHPLKGGVHAAFDIALTFALTKTWRT